MGLEDYHVVEPIGEGSFGKVYKGRRKYTGQIVAMKFILKHGKSEKDIRYAHKPDLPPPLHHFKCYSRLSEILFLFFSMVDSISRRSPGLALRVKSVDFWVLSRNLRQEIEILRNLRHESIIQMLDAFETKNEFCVVTEFAHGELFEILEDDKQLPEETVRVETLFVEKSLPSLAGTSTPRGCHPHWDPSPALRCKGSPSSWSGPSTTSTPTGSSTGT